MADQRGSRPHPALVWTLCLLAGVLVGVSGFSAESNHPAYLPPGLRYLDPAFLAGDWWLNTAHHYHLAFFALVAGLAWLGILEAGLALLNIAAVAIAMHGCFRIIQRMRAERPIATLTLIVALVMATYGFCTVGSAFLFSASLQPSTIATSATIMAIAAFLDERLGRCGLWLALAGAFHANFLVLNIAAFGLAYALAASQAVGWRELVSRERVLDLVRLLGPSLAIAAVSAPSILALQMEPVSPGVAAEADRIFFHLAVPFHYDPRTFLAQFPSFLALQALGFVWTGRALADVRARRMALGLQIALAVLIWTATALTTLVFVEPVSRLFVWRLAPFALLLATLLTVVGMVRVVARSDPSETDLRRDGVRLRISLFALPALATSRVPLIDQWLPTAPLQPALVPFVAILVMAMMRNRADRPVAINKPALVGIAAALLVFSVLAQPSPGTRYSLLYESAAEREEADLFRQVAELTPPDAQFLIPPALDLFRLQAGRAVVVDRKAVPMNRSGIVEWHRRLEAVSGSRNPASLKDFVLGYRTIDAERIERLRCRYGITHAVFEQPSAFGAAGWSEVFRNRSFRVMQFTAETRCPRSATARL